MKLLSGRHHVLQTMWGTAQAEDLHAKNDQYVTPCFHTFKTQQIAHACYACVSASHASKGSTFKHDASCLLCSPQHASSPLHAGRENLTLLCVVRCGARFKADMDAPDVPRVEGEAIQQAMQDATLREKAQADRERIRQVAALLPSFSAGPSSLPIRFCALPAAFICECMHAHLCLCVRARLHASLSKAHYTEPARGGCAAVLLTCQGHTPSCFHPLTLCIFSCPVLLLLYSVSYCPTCPPSMLSVDKKEVVQIKKKGDKLTVEQQAALPWTLHAHLLLM